MIAIINSDGHYGIGFFRNFIVFVVKIEQGIFSNQIAFAIVIWKCEFILAIVKEMKNAKDIKERLKEGVENTANHDAFA